MKRPVGRVVARFRSLTLDWIDPDSGERLQGRVEAPDDYLAELRRLGFRAPMVEGVEEAAAPPARARRPALHAPGNLPGNTNGRAGSPPAPPAPGRGTFQVRVSPGQHPSGGRNSL